MYKIACNPLMALVAGGARVHSIAVFDNVEMCPEVVGSDTPVTDSQYPPPHWSY